MNVYSIRARATRNHPGGAVASVTLMHARDRLKSFISLPLERYVNESGGPGRVPRTPRWFLVGLLGTTRKSFIKDETLALNGQNSPSSPTNTHFR